jgi:hypothetical protein
VSIKTLNFSNFTKTGKEAAKIKKISTSFGGNFMNLFLTYTRRFTEDFEIHKKHIFNSNKGPATTTVAY